MYSSTTDWLWRNNIAARKLVHEVVIPQHRLSAIGAHPPALDRTSLDVPILEGLGFSIALAYPGWLGEHPHDAICFAIGCGSINFRAQGISLCLIVEFNEQVSTWHLYSFREAPITAFAQ